MQKIKSLSGKAENSHNNDANSNSINRQLQMLVFKRILKIFVIDLKMFLTEHFCEKSNRH